MTRFRAARYLAGSQRKKFRIAGACGIAFPDRKTAATLS
jgi:hypothetical protein